MTSRRLEAAAHRAQEALLIIATEGRHLLDDEEADELSRVRFICLDLEDGLR